MKIYIERANCKTPRQQKIDDFGSSCQNPHSGFGRWRRRHTWESKRAVAEVRTAKRAILCGEEFCSWLGKLQKAKCPKTQNPCVLRIPWTRRCRHGANGALMSLRARGEGSEQIIAQMAMLGTICHTIGRAPKLTAG